MHPSSEALLASYCATPPTLAEVLDLLHHEAEGRAATSSASTLRSPGQPLDLLVDAALF